MRGVEVLPWDSEFFGNKIGQVTLDEPVDPSVVDEAARALGLRCLYVRLPQPTDPVASHDLQAAGFRLVDVALTLTCPVGPASAPADPVTQAQPEDLPALEAAVEALVPWSRFAADPTFGASAARSMYVAWLRRALDSPDELLAVRAGGRTDLAGFVAVAGRPDPTIGLLSVAEARKGHGEALIGAAKRWAAERSDVLHTVTQARNGEALGFYEKHGFRVRSSTYVFHRWYEEAS